MAASALAFADNVVVGTPQAAPAQPAPVVVQPAQAAPAQAVVVDEPNHKSVAHADVSPPHSYMGTIPVDPPAAGRQRHPTSRCQQQ